MFDCAKDVLAYHNDKVTLPKSEQDDMRERRNANRKRIKKGLADAGKPTPLEFVSQGSYAMKTMTQHPKKDYDVDDGVYFDMADLVGPRGGDMTAREAREMVRDAVDDGSFKKKPEVRKNCVRVYYDAGYQVDIPVYRRISNTDVFGNTVYVYELASAEWKKSDARDVTNWFDEENAKSPDKDNGRQVRRITREIKKFSRSRASWEDQILSGFGITKLVTECYQPNAGREDQALHDTMRAIRNRLDADLIVEHPCTRGDTITKGDGDPKAKFLRDKLSDALRWLEPMFDPNCTREKALTCWDDVYDTTFFSERRENRAGAANASAFGTPGILSAGLVRDIAANSNPGAVRKEGGGRYA